MEAAQTLSPRRSPRRAGASPAAAAAAASPAASTRRSPSPTKSRSPSPAKPVAAIAVMQDATIVDADASMTNGHHVHDHAQSTFQSRWGPAGVKVEFSGVPLILPGQLGDEQLKQYLRVLRIEDINQRLRTGAIVPADGQRSPSPAPEFGADGQRTNTRETRYRHRLEEERRVLVTEACRADPSYDQAMKAMQGAGGGPSTGGRHGVVTGGNMAPLGSGGMATGAGSTAAVTGTTMGGRRQYDKMFLPAREFPEINFMGLIIGPRGNTLKRIEAETGAKISIRGRGTEKGGRGAGPALPGADEELHCFISGESQQSIQAAVQMITEIIELATSSPYGDNELKTQQLRELALLNGTMPTTGDSSLICGNCGESGHRRFECLKQPGAIAPPMMMQQQAPGGCQLCGRFDHTAVECQQRFNPEAMQQAQQRSQHVSAEYQNFVAELDGRAPPPPPPGAGGMAPWQQQQPPPPPPGGAPPPPWAEAAAAPPPWQQQQVQPPPPVGMAPWQQQAPVPPPSDIPPWQQQQQHYPPPPY